MPKGCLRFLAMAERKHFKKKVWSEGVKVLSNILVLFSETPYNRARRSHLNHDWAVPAPSDPIAQSRLYLGLLIVLSWSWRKGRYLGSLVHWVLIFTEWAPSANSVIIRNVCVCLSVCCLSPRCKFFMEWNGDFWAKKLFFLLLFFCLPLHCCTQEIQYVTHAFFCSISYPGSILVEVFQLSWCFMQNIKTRNGHFTNAVLFVMLCTVHFMVIWMCCNMHNVLLIVLERTNRFNHLRRAAAFCQTLSADWE